MDKAGIKKVIQNDEPEKLILLAKEISQTLVDNKLKSTQIRNVFGEARKIQARWQRTSNHTIQTQRTDLILLKPKLAYQAARISPLRPLKECLDEAIDAVTDASNHDDELELQRFRRFMNLFEAIIAYHKFNGGEE